MSPLLLYLLIMALGLLLAVTLGKAAAAGDRLIRAEQGELGFPAEHGDLGFPAEQAEGDEPARHREAPALTP